MINHVILDDDVPVPTKSWNDANDPLWHCSILDTGAGQRHANAHAVHVQLRAGHLRAARNERRAGLRDPSPLFVADVDVCRRRGRGRRGRASAAGAGGAARALTGALLVATSGALPRTLLVATTALTRALLTTLLVLAAARAGRALTGALLVATSGALPRTLLVATTALTRALLTTLLVLAAARAGRALTGALLVATSGALPRTLLVATSGALPRTLLVATSGALLPTLLVATSGALPRTLLTTLLVLAAARARRALTGALLAALALPGGATCPTRAGSTLRTFNTALTT